MEVLLFTVIPARRVIGYVENVNIWCLEMVYKEDFFSFFNISDLLYYFQFVVWWKNLISIVTLFFRLQNSQTYLILFYL